MTDVPPVTERTKQRLNVAIGGWMFISFGLVGVALGFAIGMHGIVVETVAHNPVAVAIDLQSGALTGPALAAVSTSVVSLGNQLRAGTVEVTVDE